MSGGHFQYYQHHIGEIAEKIDSVVWSNGKGEFSFSKKTIRQFRKAIAALWIAEIYAQRVDWLLSGDDGEESFHERLAAELRGIKPGRRKGREPLAGIERGQKN